MTEDARDEEVREVTVEDVVFRSDDGRFAVVRARGGVRDEELTVVGDLGGVVVGETLRVRGRWSTHPTYGRRFSASGFSPVVPTTEEGMARFLGSGLVPGIGPALASRLVKRFGDRTLDVIATESARLREVDGIGSKRATAISGAVRSRRAEAETLSFLHGVGLGPALARRVMKRYGADAVRVVREDPYLVAEQVAGIGFRTADRVGRAAGISDDDPRRAAGAVLHVLARAADEGHAFLEVDAVGSSAAALSVPEDRALAAVDELSGRGLVVREGTAVYAPPLYAAEVAVATLLGRLARARDKRPAGVDEAVAAAAAGGELTDPQREAVRRSLLHGLFVLTGGPGTGKTTTVRAVVAAHEALDRRVVLLSPTGRAAKRLSEATGREARTIHRALEWNPITARFGRDASAPLEAELILVDEASMLDLSLGASLLAAVPPSATLALVGDVDQLPPVGAGQVLRELLASGIAEVVRLDQVFRQAQRSAIVRGAHAILRGELPVPTPAREHGPGDLFIVRTRDADGLAARLLEALERMSAAYGLDPRWDVQVLSPMRRGPAGTERLNEVLQAALNPAPGGGAADRPAAGGFRPGDKVMQLRNDYDREVWNGDLGRVRRVEGGITYVSMDGRDVQYQADDLDALRLAYASTVHKVQGSEFPAVIVVLHASHHVLLSRALLYTAVTRARRLVVLLGDEAAMRRAARNARTYRSQSKLVERLRRAVDGADPHSSRP